MSDMIKVTADKNSVFVELRFNGLFFCEIRKLTEEGFEVEGQSILEQIDSLGVPLTDDLRTALEEDDFNAIVLEFHAIQQVRRKLKRYQCSDCGSRVITSRELIACPDCESEAIQEADFEAGEGLEVSPIIPKGIADIPRAALGGRLHD